MSAQSIASIPTAIFTDDDVSPDQEEFVSKNEEFFKNSASA